MANVYTDAGTVYANLTAAGYDRYLEWQLRSMPIFRQIVDKHPVDVTNVGPTVTLTVMQQFAAPHITPLSENVDPDTTATPAPVRVTVTVNEYGNPVVSTLKLRELAFTPVEPAIAHAVGLDLVDSYDKLVQNVLDGATHVIGYNAGTLKTDASGFAEGSVAATDVLDSKICRDSVALLRRRNAHGRDGADQYLSLIHPDVAVDIMSDNGWLNPHQYVDTQNIYQAEIGSYLGSRYISTPRATIVTDGAGGTVPVYRTYYVGAQALVEANVIEPHVVVGPQVDHLRRFNTIGWHGLSGWSIFRQEAIQIAHTASSIAAL